MIYIHVPFCKQKCSYCNFHFSTSLAQSDLMAEAIRKELALREKELETRALSSIYFGGGTPSLWSVDTLKRILEDTQKYFDWKEDIEITLEANPDDLSSSFLKELQSSAFNRLSIGTQSFYEPDLLLMNRAHSSMEAEDSIKRSQDFGFENISIDLIYGSPRSGKEVWKENLAKALLLEVPHISAYALTVEPNTALNHWVKEKKVAGPDESLQNEEFHYMAEFLPLNGLEHYEISNFAKKGFESRHNSSYWRGREYLGLGPSAHSFNGKNKRSWNVPNNTKYLKAIEQGLLPREQEALSEKELYNERIMIGLRTREGVDLESLLKEFSSPIIEYFQKESRLKIEVGLLEIKENKLIIPKEHWFLSDGIASDLFAL